MLLDCFLSSVRNIMRKKLRSFLTIIGISIGVLLVVIISIIGEVGKVTLNSELDSMGIGGLCIRVSDKHGSIPMYESELEMVQQNSAVQAATPLMTMMSNILVRNKEAQCVTWGIDSNTSNVVNMELLYGRLINQNDIAQNAKVCVVDQAFAQENYKRDNIVGKTVSIYMGDSYYDFEVVGIVSSGGNLLQGLMGDIVPTFLYAPFTTVSKLGKKSGYTQIIAKIDDSVDEDVAISSIVRDLDSNINNGLATVKVENLNQQKDKLNGIIDGATLILSIIGGISLLVAGLSIMTVMLVTVNERTREIGIKKSIGAKQSVIMCEFLVEALILSAFGSIIGAMCGILFGILGSLAVGIPIIINFEAVMICILFCITIGVSFGVYPAIKASKLCPVEALSNV